LPLHCEAPHGAPRADLTYEQHQKISARSYFVLLLDDCDGNVAETARRANVSRTYLYELFKQLGLRSERPARHALTPLAFRQWLKT
jgi:DNA-binding NtrC family response regulator